MLPLPMNTIVQQEAHAVLLKHSFVSGHGSHLFWMRRNSVGPYLTVLPDTGTRLEYWDCGGRLLRLHPLFRRGGGRRKRAARAGAPVSNLMLAPGADGASTLRAAVSVVAGLCRRARARRRGRDFDVEVVPAMTVDAERPLRTHRVAHGAPIHDVAAEHPGETAIRHVGRTGGAELYQVRFRRLGENRLSVPFGAAQCTHLEFFAPSRSRR